MACQCRRQSGYPATARAHFRLRTPSTIYGLPQLNFPSRYRITNGTRSFAPTSRSRLFRHFQIASADEESDPTFGGKLPIMSEKDKMDVARWMRKDIAFGESMSEHKATKQRRMIQWAANSDKGTPWWQVRKGERYRPPGGRLAIVWPSDKASRRARTIYNNRTQIRL